MGRADKSVLTKVLVLNPPVENVRFSRDGRCQSEENTWLDTFPPTTLASIAGAVREKYETRLIDCVGANISAEDCLKQVSEFKPDFTIINTATPTVKMDLETAKKIKETTGSKIIIYGEHATARYKFLLRNYPQVDFAILGEPETPILSILDRKPKVKGVASRNWDGGVWQEPDLDKLPFPAYDLLPPYYYPLTGERWMFVRSGRGCPYGCIYCVMPLMSGRKLRYHSPEYMIRQFKWLIFDLKIKLWMMWDELATFDKKRIEQMCSMMVREGLDKKCKWFCTTRVDQFDENLAGIMKKAGCGMMSFGIESGNQKVLDANHKGITIGQAKKAVAAARKNKLRTIGHFVLGLPGSSPKTEEETIKFAKDLCLDFAQFYVATPFPGSQFYAMARKNKWFVEEDWNKVEQGSVNISYPEFSAEQILFYRRKAYREFYKRPITVLRGVTAMSPKQFLLKIPSYANTFTKWMKK